MATMKKVICRVGLCLVICSGVANAMGGCDHWSVTQAKQEARQEELRIKHERLQIEREKLRLLKLQLQISPEDQLKLKTWTNEEIEANDPLYWTDESCLRRQQMLQQTERKEQW